ncbi:MAG: PQQ-binding-like beta-propeller repeat protein [Verrucomicrobiota bacterium]
MRARIEERPGARAFIRFSGCMPLLLWSWVSAQAQVDHWAVEDAAKREKLPLEKIIPAARLADLTPARKAYDPRDYVDWMRSHGDPAATRYSSLDQITAKNVGQLKRAWTFHSGDGKGNIQANPVIIGGVLVTPTVGNAMVGLDAATGKERWRVGFKKRPAFRGLCYWPGDADTPGRVIFGAGTELLALHPVDGRVLMRVPFVETRAAGALYGDLLVVPGFLKDVYGVDVRSGETRWTFHTRPHEGEPGYETWDRVEQGANDWSGMALDEQRGIAYVSTGSPKPNFIGVGHLGRNLYANCIIAIDARTGKRLWHRQEFRHDIWDRDLPASPNLVTVERGGKRVDAVAQITKFGQTFLLDRMTGEPLFPIRLVRAPVSKLLGERTWPYQPHLELPEPFVRQGFSLDRVTDRSPGARASIMEKIDGAFWGLFAVPQADRWMVMLPGTNGGGEWVGACFDPTSAYLYMSASALPSLVRLSRNEKPPVDESKLPPTAGRKVYELFCIGCHGMNREGVGVSPSLYGLADRLKDEDVRSLLKKGRPLMPPFPQITDRQGADLLAYLFERDRVYKKPLKRPERPSYRNHGFAKLYDHEGYPGVKPPWGTLTALDLNTGRIAWQVPLGEHEALTRQGVPRTGTYNFGGPLVTGGGLVFCSGTQDKKIRAFDKATGEELWSYTLPFAGSAPPATYIVGGKQYLVVPATGGGKINAKAGDAWVAFSLDGVRR